MNSANRLPEQLYARLAKVDEHPPAHYGDRWEALANVVSQWNDEWPMDKQPRNKAVLDYMNDPRTPKRDEPKVLV